MTMLERAIGPLVERLAKQNRDRPPMPGVVSGTGSAFSGMLGAGSQQQYLQATGMSGWLFAALEVIAAGVASADWHLYRKQGTERRELPDTHPAARLWENINPFYTRHEFIDVSIQHRILTGEMWWLKVRTARGLPFELWPIRPDRMRIVPSREKHIAGYLYEVGNQEPIPLEVDDVVFRRRPSPLDPYRGMGVVQSILMDIYTEREAAQWTRNFFSNGAQPGGIIQLDEGGTMGPMSDTEFDAYVRHWQAQHQGVSNAHRVAFLERGKWVDRKFSMRDIQFEQLRKFDRDLILGALHMNLTMMGITESVNRANAEAGEVQFARWNVKPLLVMLRNSLNHDIAPHFGRDLEYDFIDPVPENQELNLEIAERGYKAGFLTRDESRTLTGHPPAEEGGDEYFVPTPVGLSGEGMTSKALAEPETKQLEPEPRTLAEVQADIQAAWERRFEAELTALLAHFTSRERSYKAIGVSDVDGYDWDWYARYHAEVIAELTEAFEVVYVGAMTAAPSPSMVQMLAADYAESRGAALLRVDGDANLANFTRERVRRVTAEVVEEGQSLGELSKRLRGDVAFSRSRAEMVARTESRIALGKGSKQAAINQGQDEKRWITQGDMLVEESCRQNEAQGWIPITEDFVSGRDTVPQHPRCRCRVIYRTKALHQDSLGAQERIAEFRCPDCNKLLDKDVAVGDRRWCRGCKAAKYVP